MNSISFELDKNGIAVLRFNNPESSVNELSQNDVSWLLEFLDNIDRQLDMIENEDEIRAVVLYSGKESSFINGGDIREYLNFTLADEARIYSLKAQEVTEKIESSRAPFIAAIGGACLGMGLEIVLACTYRIAAGNSQTYFGMNEVETGLIPCAGGTQRLPRLIGTREALDLILSGDTFNFDYAKNLGLIDEVVPEEILLEISMERALQISNKEFKPRRPHFRGIKYPIVNENPIARKKLFNDARKQVKKDRQPAITSPIMAIEALEVGMSSFNRGLHVESVYFGELVVSTTSRSLIRTHMALEKVKDETGFSKTGIKTIRGIDKIAVIGTSPTGIKIALLAADNGFRVRLKGDDDVEAGSGLKECYSFFRGKYENQEINDLEFEHKFDLISATSDYSGFKRSQIIFECAEDDLKLKLDILKEVEPLILEDSIYLSNSFVYPIADIASNSIRPDRVMGIRIFDPAGSSELIEISVTETTSKEALAEIIEFSKHVGKIPIVINGGAGSYTTRVQLAYFNECLTLVSEGVSIEDIEDAMVSVGFEEGPFKVMDKIGIDLVQKASNIIYQVHGDKIKPHPSLGLLVSNERIGVKNGKGFYRYHKGQGKFDKSVYKFFPIQSEKAENISHKDIQERLLLAMVNEALFCLEEGVIGSPQDGDIVVLLGLGFPSVLGGPFNYVDSIGAGEILKKLHNLSVKFGARYISPVLLKNTSVSGNKFYEN